MAKDKNDSRRKVFNFGESPLVKQTEQAVVEGYQAIEQREESDELADGGTVGQASGQATIQPVREITAPATQPLASTKNSQQQGQASVYQEPTQNINIPIPTSQHTRLKIISAQTRQPMKDMVVQAIGLWLDVQEGKREVKS